MVRPAHFGWNPETAESNRFQHAGAGTGRVHGGSARVRHARSATRRCWRRGRRRRRLARAREARRLLPEQPGNGCSSSRSGASRWRRCRAAAIGLSRRSTCSMQPAFAPRCRQPRATGCVISRCTRRLPPRAITCSPSRTSRPVASTPASRSSRVPAAAGAGGTGLRPLPRALPLAQLELCGLTPRRWLRCRSPRASRPCARSAPRRQRARAQMAERHRPGRPQARRDPDRPAQ